MRQSSLKVARGRGKSLFAAGALMLVACAHLPGQPVTTQTLLEGYGSRDFAPGSYGGSAPVVDFGLYQRPFDAFQFQTPQYVEASTAGTNYTLSSTTAYQYVLCGRTDQTWTMNHPYVRFVMAIPPSTTAAQLIVSQGPYNGALATYTLTLESSGASTESGTWTPRGQATVNTSWGQLSVSPAPGDLFVRVTINNPSVYTNITSIKFLTFFPAANTNNNQPFYNDFFGDMVIGSSLPVYPASTTRLLVQGSTTDATSNALWVTNSTGTTPAGNSLLFVRDDGAVGVDSATPAQCGAVSCALTVNGTVATKEVIVTSAISADYVFKPDYRLAPLLEIPRTLGE